jgi:hypothetical protein
MELSGESCPPIELGRWAVANRTVAGERFECWVDREFV